MSVEWYQKLDVASQFQIKKKTQNQLEPIRAILLSKQKALVENHGKSWTELNQYSIYFKHKSRKRIGELQFTQ